MCDGDSTDTPLEEGSEKVSYRTGFFPIDHKDGTNPQVDVEQPHPGIFIYRPTEGFNYPNAHRYLVDITDYIFKRTRRTDPLLVGKLGVNPNA